MDFLSSLVGSFSCCGCSPSSSKSSGRLMWKALPSFLAEAAGSFAGCWLEKMPLVPNSSVRPVGVEANRSSSGSSLPASKEEVSKVMDCSGCGSGCFSGFGAFFFLRPREEKYFWTNS